MAHESGGQHRALVNYGDVLTLYSIHRIVELLSSVYERRNRKERIDCRRHQHSVSHLALPVCHHPSVHHKREVAKRIIPEPPRTVFVNVRLAGREGLESSGGRSHVKE